MAEITSKIIDGIKVWQVPQDKLAKASDIFSAKLQAIYIKAKKAADAAGKTLSKQEISALRNHKELGMWLSGTTPLAVDSVNSFLTQTPIGAKRNVLKKVLLKVPKDTTNTFSRKFFENIDNAPREFRDWLDRLDGVSKKGTFWPKGTNFKGFKKYIAQEGYKNTLDLNKALKAKLGFDFDVGHLWGALGGKGDRTLVGPLGARSEGKFSPQNVAPQPRSLKLEQLLDPHWNVIEPNVPPFFSKAGYQVSGAQDLLDVYGGGQGWSSSLGDYLMSKSPNIEKLSDLGPREVAYVAFADPTKADFIGKTPEARYAQMFDPARRDEVFKRTADLAETAVDQSGRVKIIQSSKATEVDMNRAYISGQEYMEDLTGAPRGTLRREMTTADEAKYLQDKIVMKAQIKPKIKPKSVLNLSNVADTTAKVAKNSRLARLFIPSSAIGVALAPLTIADAHARSKRAEQTGHWLDKAQARLAQAEATADVTGAVPNPVSEAVGFGAGISNLLIDAGRWGVNKVKGEDPIQQF